MGVPTLSRVVWSEGMLLAQHHFQAQTRYFENAIHFAVSSVFAGPHGFVNLQIDEDALWNGSAALIRAAGVMPDGLPFDLGEGDELPESRSIGDALGTDARGQVLHLAIPRLGRRRPNLQPDEASSNGSTRYRSHTVEIFDETTGDDRRTVPLGAKNFKLLLESELSEEVVTLPLGLVRADGTGHYITDPNFIPPYLQIGASTRLMGILRRIVEMMDAKAASLSKMKPRGGSVAEVATHEITSFWLTHALYSSMAPLRHHLSWGRAHPKELYEDLIRLTGALCTFSVESDLDDIPLYDHGDLTDVFGRLEAQIRRHLDVVVRESYISIPLPQAGPNLFTSGLADDREVGTTEWVLRVSSSAAAATVIGEVPHKVKICSAEDVMRLVADANPGLTIEHLPSPPSKIAPRVGSHYFRVVKSGKAWEIVRARRSVGVYVPDSLPRAEVELLVIL